MQVKKYDGKSRVQESKMGHSMTVVVHHTLQGNIMHTGTETKQSSGTPPLSVKGRKDPESLAQMGQTHKTILAPKCKLRAMVNMSHWFIQGAKRVFVCPVCVCGRAKAEGQKM